MSADRHGGVSARQRDVAVSLPDVAVGLAAANRRHAAPLGVLDVEFLREPRPDHLLYERLAPPPRGARAWGPRPPPPPPPPPGRPSPPPPRGPPPPNHLLYEPPPLGADG